MMSTAIDSLTSAKEVLLIHPYSYSEIGSPTFGGTRLIAEQIAYLKEREINVKVVSLAEIGSFTSYMYKLQANMRKKQGSNTGGKNLARHSRRQSEKRRWSLNLLQVLINEFSTRIDIFYRRSVDKLIKSLGYGSLVIYHYPYGASYFASRARRNGLKFALYQHNIEWKFFEDRLVDGFVKRTLLPMARKIELQAVEAADLVTFASDKDRCSLSNEKDLKKPEMVSWIPLTGKPVKNVLAEIPREIMNKFEGKTVVGFVGTNFEPNIVAVENLIKLASTCSNALVFLIIGSVNRAFEGRNDIPQKVLFVGYVQNLDSYLSHCDLFINPKTSSDTGVETKMFDYLKFDKPILATEIGARGFEGTHNVIILPFEDMNKAITNLKAGGEFGGRI